MLICSGHTSLKGSCLQSFNLGKDRCLFIWSPVQLHHCSVQTRYSLNSVFLKGP
uniref:Uncharacterized protein n=1 Tax=Anguilla anguilla TaxID=7936 RepID=A0A0E9X1H2_ANGAN